MVRSAAAFNLNVPPKTRFEIDGMLTRERMRPMTGSSWLKEIALVFALVTFQSPEDDAVKATSSLCVDAEKAERRLYVDRGVVWPVEEHSRRVDLVSALVVVCDVEVDGGRGSVEEVRGAAEVWRQVERPRFEVVRDE